MTNNKVIQFIKDFILMVFVISFVEFLFYKLKFVDIFSISYIIGFMIGWSIIQIIKIIIDNKKIK